MDPARTLRCLLLLSLAGLGNLEGLAANRTLVLVAGRPSHPPLMHEFNAGCILLNNRLQGIPGLETRLVTNGWPRDPAVFEGADGVFLYMDGGGGHPAVQPANLALLRSLMSRGVGLGCAHFAVEVPKDRGGREFQEWIGGYYEHEFSCNPMWTPSFATFADHPVTRGVRPFAVLDEWYFNMRFRSDQSGIVPLLVARPSDDVRDGPYVYPRGPYDHIVEAGGREEIMMWAVERRDGGRGFGFTGGHFHKNWALDDFRKVVLNGLLWIAKVDVPPRGVESTPVTEQELLKNLDPKPGPKPTVESLRAGNQGPCACQLLASLP